ncbi:hypothetical protein BT63DRAFT_304305 [Microthyrium microscopicum]|uniref:DUF6594 domain-containing protein n=1 Tax=Microthyrium microscopicum TaxID=703497 RepID=A0A6A6U8F9_9PEZI|nr:hypothetical protein BT63DRAFT_304305 [Microthyrium microscopicum]
MSWTSSDTKMASPDLQSTQGNKPAEGYAKVAQLMSAHNELAIFRRFRDLNLQNLLYLQAEITHLEAELRSIALEDEKHGGRQYHHQDWWSLSQSEGGGDNEQWELILELRKKLEKYNDAVLKHAAMLRLQAPTKHNLDFFQRWLERPMMGNFPLLGLDRKAWDPQNEHDLMSLVTAETTDPFTRWFRNSIIPAFHRNIGQKLKSTVSGHVGSDIFEYHDVTLRMIIHAATTLTASVLPLCSITILYLVQNNGWRLIFIFILSVCFSLALSFMTNAQKIEIFMAVSAFGALNVVYLTNGVSSLNAHS